MARSMCWLLLSLSLPLLSYAAPPAGQIWLGSQFGQNWLQDPSAPVSQAVTNPSAVDTDKLGLPVAPDCPLSPSFPAGTPKYPYGYGVPAACIKQSTSNGVTYTSPATCTSDLFAGKELKQSYYAWGFPQYIHAKLGASGQEMAFEPCLSSYDPGAALPVCIITPATGTTLVPPPPPPRDDPQLNLPPTASCPLTVDNLINEFFYWSATFQFNSPSSNDRMRFLAIGAISGAYISTAQCNGEQYVFARMRFRVEDKNRNPITNVKYTMFHPWGENTWSMDPGNKRIDATEDHFVDAVPEGKGGAAPTSPVVPLLEPLDNKGKVITIPVNGDPGYYPNTLTGVTGSQYTWADSTHPDKKLCSDKCGAAGRNCVCVIRTTSAGVSSYVGHSTTGSIMGRYNPKVDKKNLVSDSHTIETSAASGAAATGRRLLSK